MFTIEHSFDATTVTLINDEGPDHSPDISIDLFSNCVVIEQLNPRTNKPERVSFSMAQLRDLEAALDLPEGSYRIERPSD